jgi:hypothetical protein
MSKKKKYKMICMKVDEPTITGRIYTEDCMNQVLEQFHTHKKNSVFGGMGNSVNKDGKISIPDISHIVTRMWKKNKKTLMCEIIPIEYPNSPGGILKVLLDCGVLKLGRMFAHTYGAGRLNNKMEVEDYEMFGVSFYLDGEETPTDPLDKAN